jgi:DNA (cytosine-5)-methyltransferase 3A
MNDLKIVSVFDGMACGYLAFQSAGLPIGKYVAFEIDKYAVQTSSHNFPMIEHRGDVFQADFTEFSGFDFLVGGSPCTYWSIAQKNNRETEASGMGWELFQQYVRALHEAKPKYFIYENNKSMSKAIRASVDKAFGFEAVCINSAPVSAQNRQRLYWVGKRNYDGTYSQVHVEQPEDRGILLMDVLDGVTDRDKGRCVLSSAGRTTTREYFQKNQGNMAFEPIRIPEYGTDKARPIGANYPNNFGGFEHRMFSENRNKQQVDMIAQPVGIGYRGRMEDGKWVKRYESNEEPKANALTTCQFDSMVAEPMRIGTWSNEAKNQSHDSQQYRIYSPEGTGVTLCGNGGGMGAKTGLYAIAVEFDGDVPVKAISGSDGKTYTVYEVKDGFITIKGKQYPIKLVDGYYIIRKLTVSECKRLQTVPEWYEFPVSDTRAYQLLGNGWTIAVVDHLIRATQEEYGQLNIFEMAGANDDS